MAQETKNPRKTQSKLQRTGQKCQKNGKSRQKSLHGRPS